MNFVKIWDMFFFSIYPNLHFLLTLSQNLKNTILLMRQSCSSIFFVNIFFWMIKNKNEIKGEMWGKSCNHICFTYKRNLFCKRWKSIWDDKYDGFVVNSWKTSTKSRFTKDISHEQNTFHRPWKMFTLVKRNTSTSSIDFTVGFNLNNNPSWFFFHIGTHNT